MKSKNIAVLLFSFVLLAEMATAQTSTPSSTQSSTRAIVGGGETGYLPVFSSPSAIGDSNIFQSSYGYIGIGTTAPSTPFRVNNTDDSINQFGLEPLGVYSTVTSSLDNSAAIRGDSLATTGAGYGVEGITYSGDGAGVFGVTLAAQGYGVVGSQQITAGGGGGVLGTTVATDGFSVAVRGNANGTSGGSVAIFGEQFSPDASTGLFINRANGPLLIGAVGPSATNVFRVDGNGRVFADGGFQAHGADFAESMAVTGDRSSYAAGDLLVIDPSAKRHLGLAQQPYSTLVAGIYSTKPGLLGSTHMLDEASGKEEIPLAVVGIVPCKVTAENGPIQAGDLLVASSTLGHAMKGTDRSKMLGAVVGKALEPLSSGEGVIQVLVTLQ